MKLILTQEVDGLGAPGDVVEVKDGYGRNYLVPRGLAIRWTRGGEKTVESIKAARASRAVRDQDHAEEIKTKLEAQPVPVQVRAGAGGRLFGAVTRSPARSPTSPASRSTSAPSWSSTHQDAGRPRGVDPAARRGVRHGGPQRHPCLIRSRPTVSQLRLVGPRSTG